MSKKNGRREHRIPDERMREIFQEMWSRSTSAKREGPIKHDEDTINKIIQIIKDEPVATGMDKREIHELVILFGEEELCRAAVRAAKKGILDRIQAAFPGNASAVMKGIA